MGGWWWHSRIESLQVLSTLDLDLDCDNIFPSSSSKLYEKSDIDDWYFLCVHVLRLSWLQVLELDNCPLITDVSLDHLVGCHNLQRIEL